MHFSCLKIAPYAKSSKLFYLDEYFKKMMSFKIWTEIFPFAELWYRGLIYYIRKASEIEFSEKIVVVRGIYSFTISQLLEMRSPCESLKSSTVSTPSPQLN